MKDIHPKLLSLTSDFVFRILFTRSHSSLIDLLNCALEFQNDQKIQSLTIQNTEIPRETIQDKTSVLDIKAQSHTGDIFNIEMQAFEQKFYAARALYYWARLYGSQISPGKEYTELQNTFSVNFLNFNLIHTPSYKSDFLILEKSNPNIQLTEKFRMVFFELGKFEKSLEKIDDKLELWLYTIKNSPSLDENKMRIIVDKNPVMKETLGELKRLSIDPKLLGVEEMRRKAELDYNSMMTEKFQSGLEQGIEKGLEQGIEKGLEQGIEKGLEQGIEKGNIKTAKAMLGKGYPIADISGITGLSEKQIESLVLSKV